MNLKLISIEETSLNGCEHKVEYFLDGRLKTATLFKERKENEDCFKVVLDEKINNGEKEEFLKNFIILSYQEK